MRSAVSHHGGLAVLLLLSMICLEILTTVAEGPLKSTCTSIATDQTSNNVTLTCSGAGLTWFHVIQVIYSLKSTNSCSPWTNGTHKIKSNSKTLLEKPTCAGKQMNNPNMCFEPVTSFNAPELNGTQIVNIDYECINESLNYNMCEDVSLEIPGDVYFVSPDMFGQPANNTLCRCHVKAAGLQLQALCISLDNSNQLNMTCQQCSDFNFMYIDTIVNTNLTTGTSENTTYNMYMDFRDIKSPESAGGIKIKNRVWLKISGTQKIIIQCNRDMTSTVPPSTTPIITSASTTTQSGISTRPSTSNQTSPANTSDISTQGSPAVPTSASTTSALISTTHNTTVQTATPTNTSTSELITATSSSNSTHAGLFVGGFFGGVVCVLAIGLVVFLIWRRRKNESTCSTIGFPQLASSTNRSVIPDPRVSDLYEMSPAQAGGSEAADAADITEDSDVSHVYSGLTPPTEKGSDNSSDNYTCLPQRYVNVTLRQKAP